MSVLPEDNYTEGGCSFLFSHLFFKEMFWLLLEFLCVCVQEGFLKHEDKYFRMVFLLTGGVSVMLFSYFKDQNFTFL